MTRHLRGRVGGACGLLTACLLATTAHAAILTSVAFNSATGAAGITSWPIPYTVSTPGANPSVYNSAENNYGGSSLFSLAESWTATTSGALTDVQMMISGTAPVTFNVALYDAGTTGWANIGSGTYVPGGNVSNNLFADTTPQTWNGYTAAGATAAVLHFALSGADQASIVAGRQYIFEISSTTNPNGMVWLRNPGNPTDYASGQAFRQRSPLNGNALRDMSLATTVVPEPGSLALGAAAGTAGLALRRRKAT